MKIVFFQAILCGLLLLAAPAFTLPCPAQNYQPQYQAQQLGNQQQVQSFGQAQGVSRYPLYQDNTTPSNFTPTPAYQATNRNQIQQPRIPSLNSRMIGNPVVQSQVGQPRFAAGIRPQSYPAAGVQPQQFQQQQFQQQQFQQQQFPQQQFPQQQFPQPQFPQQQFPQQQFPQWQVQQRQAQQNMTIPQVANNFGYGNRYGNSFQDEAPEQDLPSPSNLPIPGTSSQNQNLEQLAPGVQVQPQVPGGIQYGGQQYQQPIAPQPGVVYPQHQQPHTIHQYPNQMIQPQAMGPGCQYPQMDMSVPQQSPGSCYDPSCGAQYGMECGQPCGIVPPARCRPGIWFGSIGGVVFNRDFEDDHLYAYPLGMPLNNSLISTDADPGSMGGLEASFGRRYCNGFGWEFVYWGVFSEDGVGTASGGNPLTRWRTGNYIDYNVNTMDVYLNAALAYRLTRTNEFHNIELNFFRQTVASCGDCCEPCNTGCNAPQSCAPQQPCGNNYNVEPCNYVAGGTGSFGLGNGPIGYNVGYDGNGGYGQSCGPACGPACGAPCCRRPRRCWRPFCGRPFKFDVLAGLRFFSFDENLLFESSTTGDYMPHINDINYSVDVNNSMVGVQVGGNIEYCLFPRWTLVGGSRFGVYGNSISQTQQIFGIAGYGVPNVGAWAGQDYNLRSTKTDVAFMGQLDLGLRYAIGCRWNLGFGYRVLAVQGVALAPEQIPYDFSNYQEINYINSNAGLILHGAYARVGFCF